jgi:hypothetical protein
MRLIDATGPVRVASHLPTCPRRVGLRKAISISTIVPWLRTPTAISTVRSVSYNIDGTETLIPTVSEDGRIMSNEEALEQFKRSGKHLGKFDTPDNADAYAHALHEQQAGRYKPGRFDVAPARDTLGGLTREYLSKETAKAYARDGKWVTSNDKTAAGCSGHTAACRYRSRSQRVQDGMVWLTKGKFGHRAHRCAAGSADRQASSSGLSWRSKPDGATSWPSLCPHKQHKFQKLKSKQ